MILRAPVTERVAPGVVYTTFHHPTTQVNVVTTEFSDWATNCPEYKVTAAQVEAVQWGQSEWQEEYEELSKAAARRIGERLEAAENFRPHLAIQRRALVYEARKSRPYGNQIGKFFHINGRTIVPGIANHIRNSGNPVCAPRSSPISIKAETDSIHFKVKEALVHLKDER